MEKIWSDRKRLWCGLPWTFTVYSLSNDRLFVKSGLLSTREDEVRLYRILDISLKRTLLQRIFGLSTIELHTSDKTLGNFNLVNIKKGYDVKETLSQLVEEVRTEKRVTNREYMGDIVDDYIDDER